MAQQLSFIDIITCEKVSCIDCGEPFDETDLNHYTLCNRCAENRESLADIRAELPTRQSAWINNQRTSYENEVVGGPGSASYRSRKGHHVSNTPVFNG